MSSSNLRTVFRRARTPYRNANAHAALLALRAGVALLLCGVTLVEADDVGVDAPANGNPRWRSYNWHDGDVVGDLEAYAKRPDADVRDTITVVWEEPELDALGFECTLRGQAMYLPAGERERRPVNWFQGLSLYLSRYPDARPDWSGGMNLANTLYDTAVVDPSGQIVMTFDLRETMHDRSSGSRFQCGVALATHSFICNGQQHVEWRCRTAVLAGSLQMLDIQPAPELPHEVEMLARATGWPFDNPNGVDLIRAVNALQPLGKDRALAALEEYLKLPNPDFHHSDRYLTFWIIRLLFEPARLDEGMRHPGIAVAFGYSAESDTSTWPLDPMALVGDVPFMLGRQIALGGFEEPPSEHIDWARRHCVIRDEALVPTLNPLLAAETIIADPTYQRALGDVDEYWRNDEIRALKMQAMAMVAGLLPPIDADPYHDEAAYDEQWLERVEQSIELGITWDADRQEFVVPGE